MKNSIIQIVNNEEGFYDGNLKEYFRIIFRAPNVCNPYHNFRHMAHVMCAVYEGGKYENLDKNEMRILLIAAMFHDYGHSSHTECDLTEINVAIEALKKYILPVDSANFDHIKNYIHATTWPHLNDIYLSESMKILRDADLSQILSTSWMQQNIHGLATEMNVSVEDFLRGELNYLSNLQFGSNWGKEILQPKVPERLNEVKEFVKILWE